MGLEDTEFQYNDTVYCINNVLKSSWIETLGVRCPLSYLQGIVTSYFGYCTLIYISIGIRLDHFFQTFPIIAKILPGNIRVDQMIDMRDVAKLV